MKNKNILNGGYIGLLMLLIGVVIIVFFIIRTDMFSNKKSKKNMIEQGNDYINQAQKAKDILEDNSRKTMEND